MMAGLAVSFCGAQPNDNNRGSRQEGYPRNRGNSRPGISILYTELKNALQWKLQWFPVSSCRKEEKKVRQQVRQEIWASFLPIDSNEVYSRLNNLWENWKNDVQKGWVADELLSIVSEWDQKREKEKKRAAYNLRQKRKEEKNKNKLLDALREKREEEREKREEERKKREEERNVDLLRLRGPVIEKRKNGNKIDKIYADNGFIEKLEKQRVG